MKLKSMRYKNGLQFAKQKEVNISRENLSICYAELIAPSVMFCSSIEESKRFLKRIS
jgi:hypothetical protein